MLGLKPFITFNGNCEEALHYYKNTLDGAIPSLMYFEEGPIDVPEEYKKKVMYAEFNFGDSSFMASDRNPESPYTEGNNISLSFGTTDLETTEKWFAGLAKEGSVLMNLQDTFWGARFGMVADKYGINWMFNCEM